MEVIIYKPYNFFAMQDLSSHLFVALVKAAANNSVDSDPTLPVIKHAPELAATAHFLRDVFYRVEDEYIDLSDSRAGRMLSFLEKTGIDSALLQVLQQERLEEEEE